MIPLGQVWQGSRQALQPTKVPAFAQVNPRVQISAAGASVRSLFAAEAVGVGPQHHSFDDADDRGGDDSQTHKQPDNPADHLVATHSFMQLASCSSLHAAF